MFELSAIETIALAVLLEEGSNFAQQPPPLKQKGPEIFRAFLIFNAFRFRGVKRKFYDQREENIMLHIFF